MSQETKIFASFVQKQPAIFMVMVTYFWTWSFWFTSINLVTDPQGLKLTLYFLGGFGPAMGKDRGDFNRTCGFQESQLVF